MIQKNEDKTWLDEQYRNLGIKIISKLDDELVSESKNSVLWSIFRSIFMNIIRSAELSNTEKRSSRYWFRKHFNLARILHWNRLKFRRVYEANDLITFRNEHTFFVVKLCSLLLGESWNQNPVAVLKRKVFKNICKFEDIKLNAMESNLENVQTTTAHTTLESNLSEVFLSEETIFKPTIFRNVKLWRDIGLINEYPIEVAFHVVLRYIVQENYLQARNTDSDSSDSEINSPDRHENIVYRTEYNKISRTDMMIASILIKYLKSEIEIPNDLPVSLTEHINRLKITIKQAQEESIVNGFYMKCRDNKLSELLTRHYDKTYNIHKKARVMDMKEAVQTLVHDLSGKHVQIKGKMSLLHHWVYGQRRLMKRLWNFGPFEQKLKQFNETLERNGTIIQNIHLSWYISALVQCLGSPNICI